MVKTSRKLQVIRHLVSYNDIIHNNYNVARVQIIESSVKVPLYLHNFVKDIAKEYRTQFAVTAACVESSNWGMLLKAMTHRYVCSVVFLLNRNWLMIYWLKKRKWNLNLLVSKSCMRRSFVKLGSKYFHCSKN